MNFVSCTYSLYMSAGFMYVGIGVDRLLDIYSKWSLPATDQQ